MEWTSWQDVFGVTSCLQLIKIPGKQWWVSPSNNIHQLHNDSLWTCGCWYNILMHVCTAVRHSMEGGQVPVADVRLCMSTAAYDKITHSLILESPGNMLSHQLVIDSSTWTYEKHQLIMCTGNLMKGCLIHTPQNVHVSNEENGATSIAYIFKYT